MNSSKICIDSPKHTPILPPAMRFKHPLFPCLAAYILGLIIRHDLARITFLPYLMAGLLLVPAVALTIKLRRSDWLIIWACMAVGIGVMGQHTAAQERQQTLAVTFAGSQVRVINGIIASADTPGSSQFVTVDKVTLSSGTSRVHVPGRIQVFLDDRSTSSAGRPFLSGDLVAFACRLNTVGGLKNFYGFDRQSWLHSQGIYLSARILPGQIKLIQPESGNWINDIAERGRAVRQQFSKAIIRAMAPDEARLMIAMVFNDLTQLSGTDKTIFRDSNTLHLFAVSGMHVAIFAGILHMLFRAFGAGVRASWLGVIAVLLVYLWLINFVPSATRAFLMVVAFSAGHLLKREVDPVTSILFSVATIVAWDPTAPWQPGFLLSVAGVCGIVFFTPLFMLWLWKEPPAADTARWKHLLFWGTSGVMVTLAVTAFMLPLQLYYFHQWNALSLWANLIQGILAAPVLASGLLLWAADLFVPVAVAPAGQTASALMRIVYVISEITAKADWAVLRVAAHPAAFTFSIYAILLGGYYMARIDTPEFRLKSRARFTLHATGCGALLCGLAIWSHTPDRQLRLYFLDVGQGDSTVMITPEHRVVVVDAGRPDPDMGALVVEPHLRALGISHIDLLVATHSDSDHVGGLATLASRFKVHRLLVPDGTSEKATEIQELLSICRRNNVPVHTVSYGDKIRCGETEMLILNPPPAAQNFLPGDNDRSIAMCVRYRNFNALLMGDAGKEVEERLLSAGAIKNVEVLKAGHHGSRHSTGLPFLSASKPEITILSSGSNNNYSHPHPDTLSRLKASGSAAIRTDTGGAALVLTDGQTHTIKRPG